MEASNLFPVDKRVFILHAHELRPSVLLCDVVHFRELIRPHRTCAYIAHLPGLDEVVEGFHGFVDRGLGIEAVDLEQIDVMSLKALQGRINGVEDRGARQAGLIDEVALVAQVREHKRADRRVRVNESVAFCENKDLLPRNVVLREFLIDEDLLTTLRYLLYELSYDSLRLSVGVHVRRIPGSHAPVPCGLQ